MADSAEKHVRIFINYRREDTLASTGRIDEHLRRVFGEDAVFRDIDSIPIGSDFVEHIERALRGASVMIVVIGPRWLSPRLLDEQDFVRVEIEAALRASLHTIPVLVEDAKLPARDLLPESLHPLLRRNALEVDVGFDFYSHIGRLIASIQQSHATELATAERKLGSPDSTARLTGDSSRQAPSIAPVVRDAQAVHTKRWSMVMTAAILVLALGSTMLAASRCNPVPDNTPKADPASAPLDCSKDESYPLGRWDVAVSNAPKDGYNKFVSFNTKTSGSYNGGVFSVSVTPSPKIGVTLTYHADGGNYTSENRLIVSHDGCHMSGTFTDVQGRHGEVSYTYRGL